MKNKFSLISLISLISLSALSKPSDDVSYLMNTPLTLWDKGMLKLNEEVESISRWKNETSIYTGVGCSASYEFDKNKILILCMGKIDDKKTKDDAVTAAKQITKNVRLSLGYNVSDYSSYEEFLDAHKNNPYLRQHPIVDLFRHDSYQLADEPTQLGKHLEEITTIDLYIDGYTGGAYTNCRATLQGGAPMCNAVSEEEFRSDLRKQFDKK